MINKINLTRIFDDMGVLFFGQMFGGEISQFYVRYVNIWIIENFNVNVQLSKVYCELRMEKVMRLSINLNYQWKECLTTWVLLVLVK